MSFPRSDNRGLWFTFISQFDLCGASISQSGFFILEMSILFALLYPEKVYWSITHKHWNQLLPSPCNYRKWKGRLSILHGSFHNPHSVDTKLYTHTQSSKSQPWPPSHQHRRPTWQRDAAAGFYSFFSFSSLPPPTKPFFPQPWHKMVKWCSTAEFNFTVQLGPWLHCQIQINVHLTNMDQGNSGWQPAVIGAIDSCVEFYALSTPAHHWWNWLIKWIHCYNYL